MKRGRTEEVIPSAARLLGSLRDLGYDFVNAVADVVDNSISAGATEVHIVLQSAGEHSWVRIADNGSGMAGSTITEAMRLGTGQRTYTGDELGKFGLGLKTASLSQARCITVASRTHPTRATIDCRRLDLEAIFASDRWEIDIPAAADRPAAAVEPLRTGPGTVVLWERLDRILDLNDPFGGWYHRRLLRLAARLDQHLGMVFGRFLSGEARRTQTLTITVNGTKVDAWDPFCLDQRTERLPAHELRVGGSLVRYRPYVLPPQDDFSDDEAWRRASGPEQWNRQQGLYIYRADRMIQSGGWSWLRGNDEHIKLARAAVEFWPELDDAFEINVAKTRVKLPEELRDQLKPLVTMLTKRADDRYRKSKPRRDKPLPPAPPRPAGTRTGNRTAPMDGPASPHGPTSSDGSYRDRSDSPGPASPSTPTGRGADPDPPMTPLSSPSVGPLLEATAHDLGYDDALQGIRNELRRRHPEVARELGW